ncbi:chitin binding domain protein [Burkholderia pseudomallei TSV5]|nr:chitin binding domain protein [Burkholderia mallei]KGD10260.1 hypothetical protein DO70_1829 [Burkholderia pseudomallei]KGX57124.1 chitin binding domain protein [Burkholderia pseudomallei TSV5]KGX70685.1 chitin binding domain protein [Burkholderia pseudomallei TSV28]KGX99627.1 chitin binding domain protein [Burkholderia pseudomallei A79D]KGY01166.1 chitin binding domain protein [Burkholderia pseudomallei A79C]
MVGDAARRTAYQKWQAPRIRAMPAVRYGGRPSGRPDPLEDERRKQRDRSLSSARRSALPRNLGG